MYNLSNTITSLPSAFASMTRAKKTFLAAAVIAGLSSLEGVFTVVNASEGSGGNVSSGMTTALQTAFSNVQTDVTSIITTALPYALGVMGLIIAIRVGVKFFRGTAK